MATSIQRMQGAQARSYVVGVRTYIADGDGTFDAAREDVPALMTLGCTKVTDKPGDGDDAAPTKQPAAATKAKGAK